MVSADKLVFLWSEVSTCWVLNIVPLNLFPDLIHRHLLMEDFPNGLLFLSPLDITLHLELVALLLKSL